MAKSFMTNFQIEDNDKKQLVSASIKYFKTITMLSNDQIVKRSNVSYPTILNYLNGTSNYPMTDTTIIKIANALGVTIDDIMNKSYDMDEYLDKPGLFNELARNSKKRLSDNLFILRTSKNISRNEMSTKLDVTSRKIYDYEKYISIPDEETFRKLEEFFNITHDDLLFKDLKDMNRFNNDDYKFKWNHGPAVSYGINIRYHRLSNGYTLSELANKSTVPYSTISKYEQGLIENETLKVVNPKHQNIQKISKSLNVTFADILDTVPTKEQEKYANELDDGESEVRRLMKISNTPRTKSKTISNSEGISKRIGKMTADILQKRLNDRFGDNVYTIKSEYKSMTSKILLHHSLCNNDIEAFPNNLLRTKKTGCFKCENAKKVNSIEKVQNQVDKKYGKNRFTVLRYKNSKHPIKLLDNKCNCEFEISAVSIKNNINCPNCGLIIQSSKNKYVYILKKDHEEINQFNKLISISEYIFNNTEEYDKPSSIASIIGRVL